MTMMASCGVSVVAFKQSGIAERRDATADDVVDDDQNYGLLHHADGADCRRAGLVHLAGPVPGGVNTFPAHERCCPPGRQPIDRIMARCRGVRRCAGAIKLIRERAKARSLRSRNRCRLFRQERTPFWLPSDAAITRPRSRSPRPTRLERRGPT